MGSVDRRIPRPLRPPPRPRILPPRQRPRKVARIKDKTLTQPQRQKRPQNTAFITLKPQKMAFTRNKPRRSPRRLTVTRRRSSRHSPQPRFRPRLTCVIVTPLLSPLIRPRSRRLSVNTALTPLSFTPAKQLIKRRRQLLAPPRPAPRAVTSATSPCNKAAQAR